MRLLRTTLLILAAFCALTVAAPPLQAKAPKPSSEVRALRKEAKAIGRQARAAVRAESKSLLKSTRALSKQVKKGTLDAADAAEQCFAQCHFYFEKCIDFVDEAQADFSAAYADAVEASPQDTGLATEVFPLPGNAADELGLAIQFLIGEGRATANRAWDQLTPALACEELVATWTLPPWSWPESAVAAHLRRNGGLPEGFGVRPEVLAVGATCEGRLRLSVLMAGEDDTYRLRLFHAETGEVHADYTVGEDGVLEFEGLPEGVYRYEATVMGFLTIDEGVAVVPGWDAPPTSAVCDPQRGASALVNGAQVVDFPSLATATVRITGTGELRHLQFTFQDPADTTAGRAAFIFSPGPEIKIDLSGAAGTQLTFPAGAFVNLRPPGATANRNALTGVFEASGLGSLLGPDPDECIGLRWTGPLDDVPNPGTNQWALEFNVARSAVTVELEE